MRFKGQNKKAIDLEGLAPGRLIGDVVGPSIIHPTEPTPPIAVKPDERYLSDPQGGAGILLGRDRPHTRFSGYGGEGDTQAFSIRLTAGYGSCNPGIFEVTGHWPEIEPKTQEPLLINPSNRWDGATIYLSQKTDIDDDFNCAAGEVGNAKNRAAIAMKADSLRFLSRAGGIKLIAGSDNYNSMGGQIKSVPKIDFIANNDDADLQPLVKGDNLISALNKIIKNINDLNSQVYNIVLTQMSFNEALGNHQHQVAPTVVYSIPGPPAFVPAPIGTVSFLVPPSVDATVAGTRSSFEYTDGPVKNLSSLVSNLKNTRFRYLNNPKSPAYILSEFVNTT